MELLDKNVEQQEMLKVQISHGMQDTWQVCTKGNWDIKAINLWHIFPVSMLKYLDSQFIHKNHVSFCLLIIELLDPVPP